jgi:ribose transport system ATP-binding protein
MDALLSTSALSKSFGATAALQDVDFELLGGETHVLFGENGAGKSTLVKILAGVITPDAGEIRLRGQPIAITSPASARAHGIATVFQDFSVVSTISVLDNLFLGKEISCAGWLDRRQMAVRAHTIFEKLHVDIELKSSVETLGRAQQQMVEISKALLDEARVLILDEPTSSLTERESKHLFWVLEEFKRSGGGVVFISHRLDEVMQHGDRITVLRDGRKVRTLEQGRYDEGSLIRLLTGHDKGTIFPPRHRMSKDVFLRIDRLATGSGLQDISFSVHKGEVFGIGGLAGSGTSDLGRAIAGLEKVTFGEIIIDGHAIDQPSPRTLLDHGAIYFPADRLREAILPNRSVAENVSLEALPLFTSKLGFINTRRERAEISAATARLHVKMASADAPISSLSGGNQQKAVLARAFMRRFRLLVLDDPTIGVDIQTKVEIYRLLSDMSASGAAIVLISSDLEELLALSHMILVLRHGRSASPSLPTETASKGRILELFFGGGDARAR